MGDRKPMTGSNKPVKTVVVPREYQIYTQRLDKYVSAWCSDTGCTIYPKFKDFDKNGMKGVAGFDLVGNSSQVDAAVKVINHWIEGARRKSAKSIVWPKNEAFNDNGWYFEHIADLEVLRKQEFKKGTPEENPPFQTIVPWPQELVHRQITPRDSFGNKLEALDSIRVEDEVFITLVPGNPMDPVPYSVSIQGYEEQHVRLAKGHYDNLVKKICLKKAFGSSVLNIILDETEGTEVFLEAAPSWWPFKHDKIVPRLRALPINDPGSFREDSLWPDQLGQIQQAVERFIETIRFERGCYDFTIRYGCLSLPRLPESEIGTKFSLHDFKKRIDNGMLCQTKKWASDNQEGDVLLSRLINADHLLEPVKLPSDSMFMSVPHSLKEVLPSFRGVWAVIDPNDPSFRNIKPNVHIRGRPTPRTTASNVNPTAKANIQVPNFIVIQIDWTRDELGSYEKLPATFYRLKPGKTAPNDHMDVNLMELGESRSWHFGLESFDFVPPSTMPPVVIGFADNISLDVRATTDPNFKGRFVQWEESPSIKLHHCRLEKIYTFGIRDTMYRVEASSMLYPGCQEPCWGVAIRHQDWSMHLNTLEGISQGEGAEWKDIIKTFFPDDGMAAVEVSSTQNLMNKLAQLSIHGEQTHSEGIRLLVRNLMELSRVMNVSGGHPAPLSLGTGIALHDVGNMLVDLDA